MIRDPYHYLKRAEYFYQRAKKNNCADKLYDDCNDNCNYIDDNNDVYNVCNGILDNNNLMYEDNDYIYEYVNLEPVEKIIPKIKPAYKRYYDPITKHYYKIDKIFEDEDDGTPNETKTIVIKDPDVWYPENKLSFRTICDPVTGKYYRINKVYDNNGNYSYQYDKLTNLLQKKPGTNFYKPSYDIAKKI